MILFNFDVLARPGENLGARVPDPEGMTLWRAMHEATVGRISVFVNGSPDKDMVEHWLKVNGVKAASYDVADAVDADLIADKIHLYLATTGGRHMYFDTDPAVIAKTMAAGIPSLLVCQPFVVRPEWTGQRQMKSWEALTEEIDKQKLARAEKTWGDME